MPPFAKICGISTPEALDAAISGGASHVGFVHFSKSPRHVDGDRTAALIRRVPEHIQSVLLLVDPTPDEAQRLAKSTGVNVIQLHGHEDTALAAAIRQQTGLLIWKALAVRTSADLDTASQWRGLADRVLYDAKPPEGAALPGGNGLRFDWQLLSGYRHATEWGLAGGLDPSNVAEAIRITGAPLVDVSSGVESAPGQKDMDKIAAFLKAAGR